MQGSDVELLRYVPEWLPADQWPAFTERLAAALARYRSMRGWQALADPFTRGRIIGGVAAAFKGNRLDSAWGRRMLAKRGGQARMRAIAEAGEQCRVCFQSLGRRGGKMSGAGRRDRARRAHLATAAPRIRALLSEPRRQVAPSGFRAWMR